MKIYISGPMTGYPEHNFPAFDAAAERLRALGHTPVSPADLSRQLLVDKGVKEYHDIPYRDYLKADFDALFECDGILMLPFWSNSKGAKAEYFLAIALGISDFYNLSDVPNISNPQ